jgi:Bacterial regulatory helix-turn-helix protein, lysR family
VEGDSARSSERAAWAAPNRLDMFVDKSTAASRAASLWRMAFPFRRIQYFVAAAENGALSCAARELSISQSTVAEAIRDVPESTVCHRWDCLEASLDERSYHGCHFLSR